jgi:hypothetical protein
VLAVDETVYSTPHGDNACPCLIPTYSADAIIASPFSYGALTIMNIWFKLSNSLTSDPKISRLSDKLFRTWICLLCLASQNDGILPSLSDICFHLRLSAKEADMRLKDLTYRGLFDYDTASRTYHPHNWEKWQYLNQDAKDPTGALRQRRFREKLRHGNIVPLRNGDADRD